MTNTNFNVWINGPENSDPGKKKVTSNQRALLSKLVSKTPASSIGSSNPKYFTLTQVCDLYLGGVGNTHRSAIEFGLIELAEQGLLECREGEYALTEDGYYAYSPKGNGVRVDDMNLTKNKKYRIARIDHRNRVHLRKSKFEKARLSAR